MIGMKEHEKAIKFLQEEYSQIVREESSHKAALKIIDNYNKKEALTVVFPPDLTKNEHIKLKQVEFKIKNMKIVILMICRNVNIHGVPFMKHQIIYTLIGWQRKF